MSAPACHLPRKAQRYIRLGFGRNPYGSAPCAANAMQSRAATPVPCSPALAFHRHAIPLLPSRFAPRHSTTGRTISAIPSRPVLISPFQRTAVLFLDCQSRTAQSRSLLGVSVRLCQSTAILRHRSKPSLPLLCPPSLHVPRHSAPRLPFPANPCRRAPGSVPCSPRHSSPSLPLLREPYPRRALRRFPSLPLHCWPLRCPPLGCKPIQPFHDCLSGPLPCHPARCCPSLPLLFAFGLAYPLPSDVRRLAPARGPRRLPPTRAGLHIFS